VFLPARERLPDTVKAAINAGFPPLLDLAATNLGLGGVPTWLQQTLQKLDLTQYVKLGVEKLWEAVSASMPPGVRNLLQTKKCWLMSPSWWGWSEILPFWQDCHQVGLMSRNALLPGLLC
jgi:hypothetical protein